MSPSQRPARAASERTLLRSLARLYDQAPDAVLIVAADGATPADLTVRHINAAFTALSGYSLAEMTGRPLACLEHDGAAGVLERLIRSVLSDRRPARAELALGRKDAPPCPVELDLLPIAQGRHGSNGLLVTVRDLSARRDAEQACRRAEMQLRDAVNNSNDGIAFFDADDRLVICNERYVRIFPHLRELGELTGRRFEELVRHGATHGNIFNQEMMREPEKWIAARIEWHCAATGNSHMRLLPDGRWLQTVESRTADGGIISVLTDMTPARQAETRLRDAIESLDAVFTLWDDEAKLLMWNQRFAETWPDLADLLVPGVTQRALIERNIERGVLPIATQERERYIESRIAMHQMPASEIELERTDGRVFLIRSQRTAEGGQVRLETEITAARRHERELRIAKETAEAASHSKSSFLTNMSHELRTPLNAIIGFSDLLKSEIFGPLGSSRYVEYAADIHVSGRHLLDLINDVLDVSRIEAGRYELHRETVDLAELIGDAHRLMSTTAEQAGVWLTCEIPAELPLLHLDKRAVRQVLLNLLANAVKFTPPGGTVEISATREPDAVSIRIADTGIGIAASDLPRLANAFEQVENVLTRAKRGSGLGLAITKSLVELHGGLLAIASRLNEGTIVTVRLPHPEPASGGSPGSARGALLANEA